MKETTEAGMNRTGLATAPREGRRMAEDTWKTGLAAGAPDLEIARLRASYAENSGPVGSIPPPASIKGLASMALQKGMGRRPSIFIDKLGERLAFERTGTRLYEALIEKYEADEDAMDLEAVSLEGLRVFRDEELRHFHLVRQALEKLGADPTVQTPCADLAGVQSMGLVQVVTDPRTRFVQGLQAILTAELVDNEGWKLLIDLARGMDQDDMADGFQQALHEEDIHLEHVRGWLWALSKQEARVSKP
jgi:hypothetical protein